MSEQRDNPLSASPADLRRRAPLTTVLILVAVATTLSGRPVVLSGGHDAAPRLERRHLVQLLAEEFEQETQPRPTQSGHGLASQAPRWVAPPARLPFVWSTARNSDRPCCLAASAAWRRLLVNLPPPFCA